MVKNDDRIVALDGGAHEPEGLVRRRREDDAEPAGLEEERRRNLRVLGGVRARRARRADDDERDGELAAGHVPEPPGLVRKLIESDVGEAREHDVHDRAEATDGGADGSSHERGLRDRAVHDPLGAELVREAAGRAHDTDAYVLAPDDDARVVAHALRDRVGERGRKPLRLRRSLDDAHANTSSNARLVSGSGSARAAASDSATSARSSSSILLRSWAASRPAAAIASSSLSRGSGGFGGSR